MKPQKQSVISGVLFQKHGKEHRFEKLVAPVSEYQCHRLDT